MLKDLVDLYNVLAMDTTIRESPFFLRENEVLINVSYAIVLDLEGNVLSIEDIRTPHEIPIKISKNKKQKKGVPDTKTIMTKTVKKIPYGGIHSRTSGIVPFLISDNLKYLLGINEKNRGIEFVDDFINESYVMHKDLFENSQSPQGIAIVRYFEKVLNPEDSKFRDEIINKLDLQRNEDGKLDKNSIEKLQSNFIFAFRRTNGGIMFAYQFEEIKNFLINMDNEKVLKGTCLLTGENDVEISELHYPIRGIPGTTMPEVALISCNDCNCVNFLGKSPKNTASISFSNMKKYTSALSYLLNSEYNHVKLSNDSIVLFWAISNGKYSFENSQALGYAMNNPTNEDEDEYENNEEENKVILAIKNIINSSKNRTKFLANEYDEQEKFKNVDIHILVLKSNSSRVAITDYFRDDFHSFLKNFVQYNEDLSLENIYENRSNPSIDDILFISEPKTSAAHFSYRQKLFNSIYKGNPIPENLYINILQRYKKEYARLQDGTNKKNGIYFTHFIWRAKFLKACLAQKLRQGDKKKLEIDDSCDDIYFKLGEWFAICEKLEERANAKTKNKFESPIMSNLFSVFCENPSKIIPIVIKKLEPYKKKINNRKYFENKLNQILNDIGDIPKYVSADKQVKIILGHAYMSQNFYKNNKNEEEK